MCGGTSSLVLGVGLVVETLDQKGEGRRHIRELGGQGLLVLVVVAVTAALGLLLA